MASIPHAGVPPQSPQLVEVVKRVSVNPVQIAVLAAVEIGVVPQFKVNAALMELFQLLINKRYVLGAPVKVGPCENAPVPPTANPVVELFGAILHAAGESAPLAIDAHGVDEDVISHT